MRLFTALDIPGDILANLARLIERLRPTAHIQWSPADNLHITTKFIGEWPEARLDELQRVLAAIPPLPPLPIRIRNLGFFPNPRSPRVFWAGLEASGELAGLAGSTDQATAALGIEPEKRTFSPHLTLARIKEPVPLDKLRAAIAALPSLEFGSFTADRFCLYQSRLRPSGSVYTKISEFPLSK
jgi:RNA 2',3'-cyclic 3'-phosphodiesterase